jgi:hypothetical protein
MVVEGIGCERDSPQQQDRQSGGAGANQKRHSSQEPNPAIYSKVA